MANKKPQIATEGLTRITEGIIIGKKGGVLPSSNSTKRPGAPAASTPPPAPAAGPKTNGEKK